MQSLNNKKTIPKILSLMFAIAVVATILTLVSVQKQYDQQVVARELEQKQQQAAFEAAERKRTEPVPITLPGADQITAIVEDYDDPKSLWAVANKKRNLPLGYVPDDLMVPDVARRTDKSIDEQSVREDVVGPIKKMFEAAEKDGRKLMIGSAYRSSGLQELYFNNYVNASGLEQANQYSAKPGQSEHQLGLSVDISTVSKECYLSACFTSTPDGQWLANNAYKYGFNLRYPKGKEEITGYQFEPWHYRYVGVELATALHQSGITLEEALPYLEKASAKLMENGAI